MHENRLIILMSVLETVTGGGYGYQANINICSLWSSVGLQQQTILTNNSEESLRHGSP